MAGVMSGYNKVDIAIVGASSAATSPYYDMSGYEKAIFIVSAGSMGSSENVAVVLNQAVSSTGSGAQILGIATTMGSTTALACNVDKAVVARFEVGTTTVDASTVVINGITYTLTSTATSTGLSTGSFDATRMIAASSAGTSSTQLIEHLGAYINNATYGVPGLLATVGSTYITITAQPPGSKVITAVISASSAAYIRAEQSFATLECNSAEFSVSSSMRYVAVVATPSVAAAITKLNAVVIRCGPRYSPDSTALVSGYAQGA